MKTTILIFFLTLTIGSQCQSIENIKKRLQLLSDSSKIRSDTTGLSRLPRFTFFCTAEIIITEEDRTEKTIPSEIQDPWNYYSVIDLNNDGLNDLVYSGPCNPYDQTGILLNDGKSLQLIYDYPGVVISIVKGSTQTTIHSLYRPTGCYSNNELIEITIVKGKPPSINRIGYTVIPKLNLQNLKNVKVQGVLRWSPKQDDVERKDECSDQRIKGNHLLNIDKPTEAIQLDQFGQWRLVLYKTSNHESIIGWIKRK
ncbi:MAG: hypothetical protein HOP30_09305 [Cyclobacteriaceae bacterium]|nr:hypothetical protein [Cyclobacteriaceae bacterium]